MKLLFVITIAFFIGAGVRSAQESLERVGDPPLHYKPGHPEEFKVLKSWAVTGERFTHGTMFLIRVTGHEYLMVSATYANSMVHSEGCSNPKCQSK